MKQKQKRPLAGLHRMDGAVGEKSIHAGSLSGWQGTARLESHRMAKRRRRCWIDNSKFDLFKPF
jgi:hypothetical protein